MYLNRPKSVGGLSRPAGSSSSPAERKRKPPGDTRTCSPEKNTGSGSESSALSQTATAAAARPLNKYTVLPSIQRRHSGTGVGEQVTGLHVPGDDHFRCGPTAASSTPSGTSTGSSSSSSLLLAVRAPCGRRFVDHFQPTDTLMKVRHVTEDKLGTSCRGACVETMEVPRRTFTDLSRTLAQCGIPSRSVLSLTLQTEPTVEQDEP